MIKGLDKFVESEEMLEYLRKQYNDTPLEWCDIIVASRAAIKDKADALMEIAKFTTPEEFCNPQKMSEDALAAIEETQKVPSGSVFMLGEYWRDSDDWNENYGESQTPYATFDQACKYILDEYEDSSADFEDRSWYSIERWDLNKDEMLAVAVTWYLSTKAVIWGFRYNDERKLSGKYRWDSIYEDINARVPYAEGEVVLVDMSPFITPFPAVMAEAEHNDYTDCCMPQIIFINKYGKIDAGALKHIPYCYPKFSPLLRLKRYDSPLEWKDAPLSIISSIIKKDSPKGGRLVHEIQLERDRIGKTSGVCWSFLKEWEIISEG